MYDKSVSESNAARLDPCLRRNDNGTESHIQSHTIYLFDYEILGAAKTGLDVLEELHITQNAILVTSHFEEEPIRTRCAALGVKLLPKNLAAFVPLIKGSHGATEIQRFGVENSESQNLSGSVAPAQSATESPNLSGSVAQSAIFIDDDKLAAFGRNFFPC